MFVTGDIHADKPSYISLITLYFRTQQHVGYVVKKMKVLGAADSSDEVTKRSKAILNDSHRLVVLHVRELMIDRYGGECILSWDLEIDKEVKAHERDFVNRYGLGEQSEAELEGNSADEIGEAQLSKEAVEQVEQERMASEQVLAERQEQERLAAEQEASQRLGAGASEDELHEQDSLATGGSDEEDSFAEGSEEQDSLATEHSEEHQEMEQLATEAEETRLANQAAEIDWLVQERVQERLAAERADAARLERERLEAEMVEANEAEIQRQVRERLASAQAETKRQQRERLTAQAAEVTEARRAAEAEALQSGRRKKLSMNNIIVDSFRLVQVSICQVEAAIKSRDYLKVVDIANSIAIIVLHQERYKGKISQHCLAIAEEYESSVLDYDETTAVGFICGLLEKKSVESEAEEPSPLDESLSELKAALHCYNTGVSQCPSDFDRSIHGRDRIQMQDLVARGYALTNLLTNLLTIGMVIQVLGDLTMFELYRHHKKQLMERAAALWESVRQGEPFDPQTTTMLLFISAVVAPGLATAGLEDDAFVVASDMKSELTHISMKARKAVILPKFDKAQQTRLSGGIASCGVDYCGADERKSCMRRKRMVTSLWNLLLSDAIEARFEDRTLFPHGYFQAALVNSPSFTERCCNFHNENMNFFASVHGSDSDVVKAIKEGIKNHNFGEKKFIINDMVLERIETILS